MSRDTSHLQDVDGFTARFLRRVPPHVAASFTADQLEAVKFAFGLRLMDHAIDARRTFSLPWGRFYMVLLFGRDSRHEGRGGWLRGGLRVLVDTASCAAAVGIVMMSLLLAAQLVTQALDAGGSTTAALAPSSVIATR